MSLIMDKEVLLQGFDKYYNTVTKTGYVPSNIINDFIIATWIVDVITFKEGIILSDEEYDILNKLYTCIEGSCLVPYSDYCKNVYLNILPTHTYVRVTEQDSDTRITETNEIRTI